MDKYSIHARIYPMAIFLMPIIFIGFSYSIQFEELKQGLSSLGLTTVLLYLLSNLGREFGKRKELRLWESWGGMPSCVVLSYGDTRIDEITKDKYHEKLYELAPLDNIIDFKTGNQQGIENAYRYWSKFLISKTRDVKKFNLLFKENINYGFRRNLWGLRNLSLIFIPLCVVSNYLYQGIINGFLAFETFPIEFFLTEAILLILFLLWIFIFTSGWVKVPAFAYADRLLESMDFIG